MRKIYQEVVILAALAVVLWMPAEGRADQIGEPGFIKAITLISTSSDDFPLYHGSIVLETDGPDEEYRWGGSYCPGQTLNTELNMILAQALKQYAQSAHVLIRPQFSNGQGGAKCLVAFTATAQSISCCSGKIKDKLSDRLLKGKKILEN